MDKINQCKEHKDHSVSLIDDEEKRERRWHFAIIKRANQSFCYKVVGVIKIVGLSLGGIAAVCMIAALLLLFAFHVSGLELFLIISASMLMVAFAITVLALSKIRHKEDKVVSKFLRCEEQEKEKKEGLIQCLTSQTMRQHQYPYPMMPIQVGSYANKKNHTKTDQQSHDN